CSITTTRLPRRPAVIAHISPAAPPPTTSTSTSLASPRPLAFTTAIASVGTGRHAHDRSQRGAAAVAHQLQFAVLDQHVQAHPALTDIGQGVNHHGGNVDHGEVLEAGHGVGELVPPD